MSLAREHFFVIRRDFVRAPSTVIGDSFHDKVRDVAAQKVQRLAAEAISRLSFHRIMVKSIGRFFCMDHRLDQLVKDIKDITKDGETPSKWMVGVLDGISEVLDEGLPSWCYNALKRMRAFIVENLWKGKDTRVEKMATALEMGRVPTLDLDEDFDRCSPQIETSPGDGFFDLDSAAAVPVLSAKPSQMLECQDHPTLAREETFTETFTETSTQVDKICPWKAASASKGSNSGSDSSVSDKAILHASILASCSMRTLPAVR
eukprot:CAMPEP_0114678986 /NCGR_PEP_ID=MMETSP0191-20121206/52420_1 /TAXON_ID=126664 /ORGANISM="Sorites sp." /LENGTH=260 /DNA_ID=CAMNT_0001953805 /DNA_START=68 /DNA_END=849 /DNA_ORIENTATION=-